MVRTVITRALWHQQLRDLQRDCEGAGSAEERSMLRGAYRIIAESSELPGTLRPMRKQDFESLLALGGHESAAIGLLGPGVSYMVSKGPSGIHFATVVLDGHTEASAAAETLALALVAAVCCALREDTPSPAAEVRISPHQ